MPGKVTDIFGYRPKGISMWDTWCVVRDGVAHAYYLQVSGTGDERSKEYIASLGHAISSDLINWTECAPVLPPNIPGTLDDMQVYTGCTIYHDSKYYLYYTMRSSVDNGAKQCIGLAISDDGYSYQRYSENPIITPDPRWYISEQSPIESGIVDCRDLVVVPDPDTDGWIGYYAARTYGEEISETSAVACVRSSDLLHWEHLPPVYVPKKYACIEVPDVFELNGRWYLTCLTGNWYGNRMPFSDSNVIQGTIYAVADSPFGPFEEILGDNVMFGGDRSTGYSSRSLEWNGERVILYTQPSLDGPVQDSTLSPPMCLATTNDGRLRAYRTPAAQIWRSEILIDSKKEAEVRRLIYCDPAWHIPGGRWNVQDGAYIGESRTSFQIADIGLASENVEIEVDITLESGIAAGIALYASYDKPGFVIGLDAEIGCAFSGIPPTFEVMKMRKYPFERGRKYRFALSVRRPRVELFVDDELVMQFAFDFPSADTPFAGLFIDRGRVIMENLILYKLEPNSEQNQTR